MRKDGNDATIGPDVWIPKRERLHFVRIYGMKKKVLLGCLAAVILLAVAGLLFWNQILDLLPIDQSGWKERDGYVYYLNEKGDPKTGWLDVDGKRYYMAPENGAMVTGWLNLDGSRYYLGDDGVLLTGWRELENQKYYFDESGKMVVNWADIDGNRYYFGDEGNLQTGWMELSDAQYYFGDNGAMVTGWVELEDGIRYFGTDGVMTTGWLELDGARHYLADNGIQKTGWLELEGNTYYLDAVQGLQTGWLELPEGRYYLDETGNRQTGWLEQDGKRFFLQENGAAARGKLKIGEETFFFTSTGAQFYMVNRWYPVPKDYIVELKALKNGRLVAAECYDALVQMVADCTAAGCHPDVIDGNRTNYGQSSLFSMRLKDYMQRGCSYEEAYALTAEVVAIPGTSEHQLGLAVDILDMRYPKEYIGDDNCLIWLQENCWKYGFIVRYPNEKKEITGIIFEPWHYRYVGVELAMELKELGLCLEEYIDMLTNDGTTVGGKAAG